VSLVPPDPLLSDGAIILRPLDERDVPAIERAARNAEIRKWFDLHTHEMRLGRLQLHTDTENVASQRVAEGAGFTREGVLRAYNGRWDGTRVDAVVYSLLPQDLPTRSADPS
jgi:hypothetical protein